MSRLIDADALMDALGISEDCEDCQYSDRGFLGCKKDPDFVYACEVITDAPTIDPVKHGRWIHDGQQHRGGVDWMHCSECGYTDVFGAKSMFHYCPNCGAIMVKGEEDETD